MNKLFVLSFSLLFASNVWAESLLEIYSLAVQNDYQLKAAQSASLAGQEIANIAKSGLLPKLNAEAAWIRSETSTEIKSSNPLAIDNELIQENKNSNYTISLTQPLINLPALHDYKRSELSGQVAVLQLENVKRSLIMRTADAYLQILQAGAKLAAAQSAEEAYRLHLKAAKAKFDVGLARMSDVLEAKARSDSAIADSAIAQNNLNDSFAFLRIITGHEHLEVAALSENIVPSFPVPMDFKQWADAAAMNNIEINLAKLKTDEAYKNYQSKVSEHLPKLTGAVSYSDSYDDRAYNNVVPDTLYAHGLSASLTLSVPLYGGGGTSASAREANYRYLESRDNSNYVARAVAQTTQSIYLKVITDVAVVNARKVAMESSQSALTYAQKGYEEGLRSMIDVLDAQNILYQTNLSYSDALYGYLIAGLKLKEVSGLLSIKDIEELNQQLDKNRKIYLSQ